MTSPGETDSATSGAPQPSSNRLTSQERQELLAEFAKLFSTERATRRILDRIGFSRERRLSFNERSAEEVWSDYFLELESGIIENGYSRLLEAAIRVYSHNRVLRPLADRYGVMTFSSPNAQGRESPARSDSELVTAGGPPTDRLAERNVHVIIRTDDDESRQRAEQTLEGLGFRPLEVWSTAHATSYRVDAPDMGDAARLLGPTDLGWTLVPPGEPDYLLRELFVTGPDGRRFRITDVPAAQTVQNIASEVIDQYPLDVAEAGRPTVVDRLGNDQHDRRLAPENTLHDAGIRDDDQLHVGFENRAGATATWLMPPNSVDELELLQQETKLEQERLKLKQEQARLRWEQLRVNQEELLLDELRQRLTRSSGLGRQQDAISALRTIGAKIAGPPLPADSIQTVIYAQIDEDTHVWQRLKVLQWRGLWLVTAGAWCGMPVS